MDALCLQWVGLFTNSREFVCSSNPILTQKHWKSWPFYKLFFLGYNIRKKKDTSFQQLLSLNNPIRSRRGNLLTRRCRNIHGLHCSKSCFFFALPAPERLRISFAVDDPLLAAVLVVCAWYSPRRRALPPGSRRISMLAIHQSVVPVLELLSYS